MGVLELFIRSSLFVSSIQFFLRLLFVKSFSGEVCEFIR